MKKLTSIHDDTVLFGGLDQVDVLLLGSPLGSLATFGIELSEIPEVVLIGE